MIKHKQALTIVELIVVVIIVAILAALAVSIPRGQIERARETEAQTNLKLIWAAEKDYYIYNGHYSADWADLNIDDPNLNSENFTYLISSTDPLLIKATRTGASDGFQIDGDGAISEF